ncbi:MAG: hypothetical protein WDW38_004790 [Sanguina aurantia]
MSSSSETAFIQEGSGHSLTEVVLDDITNPDGDSSIPSRSDVQREDTITAIVTGASQGSVSIIRLSGPEAAWIAGKVFRYGGKFRFDWTPESHRVYHGTAVDGKEAVLDEVLLICMRAPRSYTAEDVIELHCHGGGVCAERVLRATIEAGARPAKPGEFTLRAFLNGRLGLSQAESVMELVTARTPAAADSALAGLQGGLGQAVAQMRQAGLMLLGELEARLDFEEDLPAADLGRLTDQVSFMQRSIEDALRTAKQGNLLRKGLQVAIVGRPNVGKSSLLNAWSRTNRAIVTAVAGTTRDVLEAGLVKIGVERSQAAAVSADVVIMVVDAQQGWTRADSDIFTALWGEGPGTASCRVQGLAMLVANKCDLLPQAEARFATENSGSSSSTRASLVMPAARSAHLTVNLSHDASEQHSPELQASATPGAGSSPAQDSHSSSGKGSGGGGAQPPSSAGRAPQSHSSPPPPPPPPPLLPLLCKETFLKVVSTSAATRQGLDSLDTCLLQVAGAPQLAEGGVSWAVNARQSGALVSAHESLMRVVESSSQGLPIDFWTIDLRSAIISLGEVDGDDVTEEVLDNIFSRFCIGK